MVVRSTSAKSTALSAVLRNSGTGGHGEEVPVVVGAAQRDPGSGVRLSWGGRPAVRWLELEGGARRLVVSPGRVAESVVAAGRRRLDGRLELIVDALAAGEAAHP